jgi:hypothetical protein
MEKLHTQFKLKIEPVGEKSFEIEHLLRDMTFESAEDLDEHYLDYGYPGNHLIQIHRDESKYYSLKNWSVIEFELLSACDIGATRALKMMDEVQKRRKANNERSYIETLQGDVTIYIPKSDKTINPNGGYTISHYSVPKIITEYEWLSKHLDNCWINLKGEIIPIDSPGNGISHVEWASDYLDENCYDRRDDDDFNRGDSSSDILERMGFIRMLGWNRDKGDPYLYSTGKYPNLRQWKSIQDICFVKEQEIPTWNKREINFER